MNDTERLHFLAGEVNGLRAAVFALIHTHPDHAALVGELERLSELTVSLSNPVAVTEDYLAGQSQTIQEVTSLAKSLAGR